MSAAEVRAVGLQEVIVSVADLEKIEISHLNKGT